MFEISDAKARLSNPGGSIALDAYCPGPSIEEVLCGEQTFARGASGDGMRALQRMLNRRGAEPPLDEDGLFGPLTERAVRQLRERRSSGRPYRSKETARAAA
jgi:putative peptidoglycan binding protein